MNSTSPYSNDKVLWSEDVAALNKADKGHVVNKLNRALTQAKADPRTNEHLLTPGTIEQVVADAIEVGDVDRVLAGMTDVIGTRLGMAAGFNQKRGEVLK